MLYVFGLSVAVFLFSLILLKKDKRRADYILLTWIGVLVIHLALFTLYYTGILYQYPHLLGISLPLPVLHGAFIYFYTLELIRKESPLTIRVALLHLIPFLCLNILAIPFFILPATEKVEVFRNKGQGFEWYTTLQMVVFLVVGFTYSVLSIREIRRYRAEAVNQFSNLDKKMLRWLETLAVGMALIWLLSAFSDDLITFAAVVFFVLIIGFFGINQYPVFYSIPVHYTDLHQVTEEIKTPSLNEVETMPEAEKYTKSGLSVEKASDVMERLEETMRTKEPFRNPNLTLDELAGSIQVSPNHLSQVINAVSGKTFYNYINTYRIDQFVKLAALPESRKFTYLGLAYRCGFSSKTTFNKYFKLQTGKTPSEYFGSMEETSAETFAGK